MRVLSVVCVLSITACTGGDPTSGQTGDPSVTDPTGPNTDDTVTNTTCFADIIDVDPTDNAGSVPLNTAVTATFDIPVEEGEFSLGVTGVEGVTTLASNGLSATWVSDTNLEVDTTYTVEAQACRSSWTSTFTTVGPPVTKVDVEGNTYALDWAGLTFVEPPRGGALLAGQISFDDILFQFVSIDEKTEEATVGATVSVDDPTGAPSPFCGSYISETADFSNNPFFEFGPQTVEYPAFFDSKGNVTGTVEIEDLELSFEVSADGTKLLNPVLSGLIPIEPLLGAACVDSFEIALAKGTCVKCTVAPSGQCLVAEATAAEALLVSGFDLDGECVP